LLHPLAAAAVATLLVNDHVLKPMFATWWTGKLSDAAALVVVALVVQAVGELIGMPRGRPMLLASMIVSAATLIGIKVAPVIGDLYQWGVGAVQSLPSAAVALVGGWASPPVVPVALTRDPTDLLTLPALAVVWLAFRHRGS
jgi:hypothetical protein